MSDFAGLSQAKSIKIRIVLTGGGSGGHIFPLISVFRSLRGILEKRLIEIEGWYVGPSDGFAKTDFEKEKIKINFIPAGKLRRYFSLLNFIDFFKVAAGFFKSLVYLWKIMPEAVFSKGGFGALPVVWAARILRIPVFIHESDSVPGLTNKLSANFSSRIGISFDRTFQYFPEKKTALVGNPIRNFGNFSREESFQKFNFNSERPLILVLGGSQGSRRINDLILDSLEELIRNEIQIFHQTGALNFFEVSQEAKIILENLPESYRGYYQASGFFNEEEYARALIMADLVVARAGSGTIFELAAFGKPAILIPLPEAASDHQRINALEYSKNGAALVLEEKNILPNLFIRETVSLLENKNQLKEMSEAAVKFNLLNPSEKIALEILKMINWEI